MNDTESKSSRSSADEPAGQLSRRRPAALYQQVKNYILEKISAGEWPPETRVPSENTLITQLGASKMTVNRALRELTAEGVLRRLQGVGTFVAKSQSPSTLLDVKPIAEEIAQRGGVHSCEVHLQTIETATPELAQTLSVPAGARLFHVVLIHSDDAGPLQLEDRYVNPAMAPHFLEQDFTTITPSRYLLDAIPVSQAEHIVEAVLPDAPTQKLLEISPAEPCLVLYRRTWSDNRVVTRSRFVHPGSRYRMDGRFVPSSPFQAIES
jgi:GntR family histidine utilization transcriptional repressor